MFWGSTHVPLVPSGSLGSGQGQAGAQAQEDSNSPSHAGPSRPPARLRASSARALHPLEVETAWVEQGREGKDQAGPLFRKGGTDFSPGQGPPTPGFLLPGRPGGLGPPYLGIEKPHRVCGPGSPRAEPQTRRGPLCRHSP